MRDETEQRLAVVTSDARHGEENATHGEEKAGLSSQDTSGERASSSLRPPPSALLKVLVQLSRFGLALMFLVAAGAKLWTLNDFVVNMSNLVDERWVWPVTLAVIAAELLAVVLLIVPRTVRAGGALSALMLVGFAGYALYYVYVLHGEPLECGCFGGLIASQLGVKTALRNLALLVPAALVFFGWPRLRRAGKA